MDPERLTRGFYLDLNDFPTLDPPQLLTNNTPVPPAGLNLGYDAISPSHQQLESFPLEFYDTPVEEGSSDKGGDESTDAERDPKKKKVQLRPGSSFKAKAKSRGSKFYSHRLRRHKKNAASRSASASEAGPSNTQQITRIEVPTPERKEEKYAHLLCDESPLATKNNYGTYAGRVKANPLKYLANVLRYKIEPRAGEPVDLLQVASEMHEEAKDKHNTALRRIYDVVNVLHAAGVIERTHGRNMSIRSTAAIVGEPPPSPASASHPRITESPVTAKLGRSSSSTAAHLHPKVREVPLTASLRRSSSAAARLHPKVTESPVPASLRSSSSTPASTAVALYSRVTESLLTASFRGASSSTATTIHPKVIESPVTAYLGGSTPSAATLQKITESAQTAKSANPLSTPTLAISNVPYQHTPSVNMTELLSIASYEHSVSPFYLRQKSAKKCLNMDAPVTAQTTTANASKNSAERSLRPNYPNQDKGKAPAAATGDDSDCVITGEKQKTRGSTIRWLGFDPPEVVEHNQRKKALEKEKVASIGRIADKTIYIKFLEEKYRLLELLRDHNKETAKTRYDKLAEEQARSPPTPSTPEDDDSSRDSSFNVNDFFAPDVDSPIGLDEVMFDGTQVVHSRNNPVSTVMNQTQLEIANHRPLVPYAPRYARADPGPSTHVHRTPQEYTHGAAELACFSKGKQQLMTNCIEIPFFLLRTRAPADKIEIEEFEGGVEDEEDEDEEDEDEDEGPGKCIWSPTPYAFVDYKDILESMFPNFRRTVAPGPDVPQPGPQPAPQ